MQIETTHEPMDFTPIADLLLHMKQLDINGNRFWIREIEFYHNNAPHSDPFTHGHTDQCTDGCWYFHKTGNSYRGGTYKGLDITFGSEGIASGVLIRSIENKDGLIEGPCRVVNKILELCDVESIAELLGDLETPVSCTDGEIPLQLVEAKKISKLTIYTGPRVGLSLKKKPADMYAPYLMMPLRFLTRPKKIKKYKALMALRLLFVDHIEWDVVAKTFGTTEKKLEDWVELADEGAEYDLEEVVDLKLSTIGNLCRAFGWCEAQDYV